MISGRCLVLLHDHIKDITNFQEMVAQGDISQGSVSFINPFGTSVPRLYEDVVEEESGGEGDLVSQQASCIAQLEAEIAAARRHNATRHTTS